MKTFNKIVAKAVKCPVEKSALQAFVDDELRYHDDYVCHMLTLLMGKRAEEEGIQERDIEKFGQKLFGKANYQRVCKKGKLPSPRNFIAMTAKLDQIVVFRNYPYFESGSVGGRDFVFGKEFDEREFLQFLNNLGKQRLDVFDSQEMKDERARILEQLNAARPKFDWKTLMRFSIACGYQPNFYPVNEKPAGGCLSPSTKVKRHENADSEEYQALLRRLNYPH